MAARDGKTVTSALTSWDGEWYLNIAASGYGGVPASLLDAFGHRSDRTPLAFFPGYPALVRAVSLLPGVDVAAAGLTVSLVCGIAGAYAVARLGRRIGGSPQVGLILVALFAASPMAIALSMAYSEAMFCALAAWTLVGVLERRWVLAGLCALGAGLVRPTAAALVVTVIAAAVVTIARRRDGIRPWVGLVLAPAGLLAYLGFVAARTGSATGWFQIQQQGWGSMFDGGVATVRFGLDVLASGRSVLEVVTVAVLLIAILLLALSIHQRLAWPLVLYGALVLAMDLGSNGLMNSKARMLLPAFTLLVPLALALAKRRPRTMIAALAAIAVASAWFGAYALTGWPYAI
jgi:Gpi18-like mannosyltransferase